MGNSSPKQPLETFQHPKLGITKKLVQDQKQFLLYEIILQNKKIYEEWQHQTIPMLENEQLSQILFLPVQQQFNQTAYCGTGGTLKLTFEAYFYSILPQIENRRNIKRPFSQQELLYLFYCLIKLSRLLERDNRLIGDVKPENILVNQDGFIKIISNNLSWPNVGSNGINKQRIFLSPEQCEDRGFKDKQYNNMEHLQEKQIYSIGLTILEAGTLVSSSNIYTNTYKFNEHVLVQHLDMFSSRYSKQLSQMIRAMLNPIPKKRWRTNFIYEKLKPYETQIMNLQEISLKLQRNSSLSRYDRDQKISIRRMGQSMGASEYSQKSQIINSIYRRQHQRPQMQSRLMSINGPQRQNRAQQNYYKQARLSSYHGSQNNPIMMNYASFVPQEHNQVNLVNQYSSFNKNKQNSFNYVPVYQPQSILNSQYRANNYNYDAGFKGSHQGYDPRIMMVASMPLDISNYQQDRFKNTQNYVTQQSMVNLQNNTIIGQSRQL